MGAMKNEPAMSDILQEVDGRSKLAGTNKFELLIFRLGEELKFPCRGILRHQYVQGARGPEKGITI
ncbi:hypothetical protein [Acidithiobacillus sulfuriphilus]|uniref:hypothetical protein n=1 Tax=Acidithiobacillus sulfuriphilus TaxID=1867749 RepID=UPI003F5EBFF9